MFTDVSEERAAYLFYSENGSSTFTLDVGEHVPDYTCHIPKDKNLHLRMWLKCKAVYYYLLAYFPYFEKIKVVL
jgi:hypothetical protein